MNSPLKKFSTLVITSIFSFSSVVSASAISQAAVSEPEVQEQVETQAFQIDQQLRGTPEAMKDLFKDTELAPNGALSSSAEPETLIIDLSKATVDELTELDNLVAEENAVILGEAIAETMELENKLKGEAENSQNDSSELIQEETYLQQAEAYIKNELIDDVESNAAAGYEYGLATYENNLAPFVDEVLASNYLSLEFLDTVRRSFFLEGVLVKLKAQEGLLKTVYGPDYEGNRGPVMVELGTDIALMIPAALMVKSMYKNSVVNVRVAEKEAFLKRLKAKTVDPLAKGAVWTGKGVYKVGSFPVKKSYSGLKFLGTGAYSQGTQAYKAVNYTLAKRALEKLQLELANELLILGRTQPVTAEKAVKVAAKYQERMVSLKTKVNLNAPVKKVVSSVAKVPKTKTDPKIVTRGASITPRYEKQYKGITGKVFLGVETVGKATGKSLLWGLKKVVLVAVPVGLAIYAIDGAHNRLVYYFDSGSDFKEQIQTIEAEIELLNLQMDNLLSAEDSDEILKQLELEIAPAN